MNPKVEAEPEAHSNKANDALIVAVDSSHARRRSALSAERRTVGQLGTVRRNVTNQEASTRSSLRTGITSIKALSNSSSNTKDLTKTTMTIPNRIPIAK